jgi:mannose-6-phosphate isomerase
MLLPFRLKPIYRDYVWGGKRLKPDAAITAEAWVVCEDDLVMDGPYAGQTLAAVAEIEGKTLLGSIVFDLSGIRFPLLIKLLDCANWLSLQVHPDNEQAAKLEGPGHFGKNEAWYVIEAEQGAELISGFRPGVTCENIQESAGKIEILDLVERRQVHAGDSIFIAPGTIHALGAGLLIYEVQQNSDITYRVYDWDRPMDGGRKLHIEESITVLNPAEKGEIVKYNNQTRASKEKLVECDYFTLELLHGKGTIATIDSNGESFSAITSIDEIITISGEGWSFELNPLESLLIPADCSHFTVSSAGEAKALLSHCG